MHHLDSFINQPVYDLAKSQKNAFFLPLLNELTQHHQNHCVQYKQLLSAFNKSSPENYHDILPVATQMFKHFELKSVSEINIFKRLVSSGTSGAPSTIFLDGDTARLQTRILIKILQQWLGKERLPLLLIDAPNVIKSNTAMSARAAGLQGLSFIGYDHTYALNEDMTVNVQAVAEFFKKHQDKKVLMFGFTFMVWKFFIEPILSGSITLNLSSGVLIHGGGWKKLANESVSNQIFKERITQVFGNKISVHDYYGMVEQTGTIYLECAHGYLHCPVWSDVLIRDPKSLMVCDNNTVGLIQVNSLLALSYPGHCLLTEDLGEIIGEDDCLCGKKGKYFIVHGRVPQSEKRGCSDTFS